MGAITTSPDHTASTTEKRLTRRSGKSCNSPGPCLTGSLRLQYIEPRPPWENGYSESFKGQLRDELFNTEIF
jgi:hypothetical protein